MHVALSIEQINLNVNESVSIWTYFIAYNDMMCTYMYVSLIIEQEPLTN